MGGGSLLRSQLDQVSVQVRVFALETPPGKCLEVQEAFRMKQD